MRPLAFLSLLVACTVTDTGNPPNSPDIDPDLLENETSSTGSVMIRGGAGAVVPPRGVVRIVLLDGVGPAGTGTVEPDGSFSASVGAEDGGLLRLQVVDGELRSEPVDITGEGNEVPPAPACLVMPSWQSVAFDDTGMSEFVLTLTNECEGPLAFGAPTLRRTDGPFTLEPLNLPELSPAESVDVAVQVQRSAAGEAVLFLPLTGSTSARRAVTLVVHSPDT